MVEQKLPEKKFVLDIPASDANTDKPLPHFSSSTGSIRGRLEAYKAAMQNGRKMGDSFRVGKPF